MPEDYKGPSDAALHLTGDRYLTLTELRAKLGGRSRSAIYGDVTAGRLPPPLKLGGRIYWCESAIDSFLRETRAV